MMQGYIMQRNEKEGEKERERERQRETEREREKAERGDNVHLAGYFTNPLTTFFIISKGKVKEGKDGCGLLDNRMCAADRRDYPHRL